MSAPDPKVMSLIPAGSFDMGDPLHEGNGNESPLHAVDVSAFYMDRYLVTKAMWDGVYAWATGHGYEFENPGSRKAPNHPVETVRSEEHTSELQSLRHLVCRLLLEK